MAELTRLGKYQIRRELGKGAMGIVYEGFDPLIERTVAIKTIRPEQLNKDQAKEILARFRREAQAAGRLSHPHIVSIYEYGEDAETTGGAQIAFIAMEFIKGRELRSYFEANERFPLKEVVRIMGEILDALGHAHERGVTHRDMKPANVILLENGAVKVADFGIARLETSDLTQAGAVLGTPAYMSPEQFTGQPVDGRSDIFSCGVTLYQFLTGEKPFTGNVTTIMYKVLSEDPLAPSMLNTALPAAWDTVVRKAMAKKVSERFQTAAEFAAAIRAVAETQDAQPDVATGAAAEATLLERTIADDRFEATTVRMDRPSPTPPPSREMPPPAQTARPAAVVSEQAPASVRKSSLGGAAIAGIAAGVIAVVAAGAYFFTSPKPGTQQAVNQQAPAKSAEVAATPAAAVPVSVPVDIPTEPGTMVISALGLVDPTDPRFNGDQSAAKAESRTDAKRQLIDKALTLYVQRASLDKNYGVIQQKLLADPNVFIKTVISEGAPEVGKDGLIATEARAAVKVRAVQKSLNEMSKEERIDFIRNSGDPKISVLMAIRNADTAQALPAERSHLAENVIKERIRSFGFRVWAPDGEIKPGPDARPADFQIQGEVRVKLLSMRLPASGVVVSKTALTSWTIKAIDRATGEEIYLNTTMPKAQSWPSEDQALMEIGRLVGEEFSKNFFLQHFAFGEQKVRLNVTGLPAGAAGAQTARQLLRELRSIRQVLDAQPIGDSGRYQLHLPEGSAADIIQDAVLKPLNAKLGQSCFTLAGATAAEVNVSLAPACGEDGVRSRFETEPPAGLLSAPEVRGKALWKGARPTNL